MMSRSIMSPVQSEGQVGITTPRADLTLSYEAQDIQNLASTPRSVPSIIDSLYQPTYYSTEDSLDSENDITSHYGGFETNFPRKKSFRTVAGILSHATNGEQEIQDSGNHRIGNYQILSVSQKQRINRSFSETYASSNIPNCVNSGANLNHNTRRSSLASPKLVSRPLTA